MTSEEKRNDPDFHIKQGYLKTFTYEEAWANFWRDTDEANRKRFFALPHFDAEIFKEITGIDVDVKPSCHGEIITHKGQRYRLEAVNER